MRYIFCLLTCVAVIFIAGCPTEPKGSLRPVKKRLCSLVIIGNYVAEAMEADQFNSTIFKGLLPMLEPISELPDSDMIDDDEDDDERDVPIEALVDALSKGPQKPGTGVIADDDDIEAAIPKETRKERSPMTEKDITELCDRHLQEFLKLNEKFLRDHPPMTEKETVALCEHYLREFLKLNEHIFQERRLVTEERVAEICERHLRNFLKLNGYLSDEPPPLTEAEIRALRETHLSEFLKLNRYISAEVQAEIAAANFQNYSVWVGKAYEDEFYAVRYFEYVGDQFDLDYFQLVSSPAYKMWIKQQEEYLRPRSTSMVATSIEDGQPLLIPAISTDVWLNMGEVMYCCEPKVLTEEPAEAQKPVQKVPEGKKPSLADVGEEED